MMIDVANVVKEFGQTRALAGVSFTVPRGAVYGLIGPNGAGKTTCLNILATLVKPTSGTVTVDNVRIDENPRDIRRKLGYMPDFFGICRHVTAVEYLDFYGGACGLPAKRRRERIAEVLELTRLKGKQNQLVDNLSRGMKQRLCLAKALIHQPTLLILDEPASGLDPRARNEIRDILRETVRQDTTVVISSHILSELDDICTHVGIIEQGKLLKSGTLSEILEAAKPRRTWVVRVQGSPGAVVPALLKMPPVAEAAVRDDALVIRLDENALRNAGLRTDALPADVLKLIVQSDVRIVSINEDRPDLEQAFLTLTQGLLA